MEENPIQQHKIMQLLEAWRAGDNRALMELTPIIYRELHHLAVRYMRRERVGHTLQATALVNEAFTRLVRGPISVNDTRHFLAVAARLMRNILVDHSKSRGRLKRRGKGNEPLPDSDTSPATNEVDLIILDTALAKLEALHADIARTVELIYFGGLTLEETAQALGISSATVTRDLRFAKAWLLKEIQPKDGVG